MKSFAYVLLIIAALTVNMLSDILIRAGGLDHKNGITAYSWDLYCYVLIMVGVVLLWKDRTR